jgi:hypothetical protein
MLSLIVCSTAPAEIIRMVSPAAAENIEGNTSRTPRLVSHRLQWLFPASDFADLPETHRLITAFNLRADRTQTQPGALNFGSERIWMSTTRINSLTSVFDNNQGPDKTLVHDGPMSFPLLPFGSGPGPARFIDGISLQTPFFYDPSQGNLLIERIVFANSPSGSVASVDLQSTPEVRIVVVDNPSGTAGGLSNAAPVVQFQFVPEPATFVLACCGLICLVVWQRKVGRNFTR